MSFFPAYYLDPKVKDGARFLIAFTSVLYAPGPGVMKLADLERRLPIVNAGALG